MSKPTWLTNHLLIAMPAMQDPNFYRSVTYICQHNEQGAMGLVINRSADMSFREVLRQIDIDSALPSVDRVRVVIGGPVQQERGFVLHGPIDYEKSRWDSTFSINDTLQVTTSRDVLEALAIRDVEGRALLALGYAGWDAGQLERELIENAWLTVELKDQQILFETPMEARWHAAAALIGVDITRLTPMVGHA